jgi:hypothetical protein
MTQLSPEWLQAVCVLATLAVGLAAQRTQVPDPTGLLLRARNTIAERDRRLPDYTCGQTVDRCIYVRRHTDDSKRSCDQIRSLDPKGLELQSTDRLRLDVKVSEHQEIGTWHGSEFTSSNIFELIGGGPYATGMMGLLVSNILGNPEAMLGYLGEEVVSGAALPVYSYRVPLSSSLYKVRSGRDWVRTAFSGKFWLDPKSLDLKRLLVQADDLPNETGECVAITTVEYQQIRVGDGQFVLPVQSSFTVVTQDGSQGRVTAVYSGCREYRGEAAIHFNEVPAPQETRQTKALHSPIPARLPLALALTEAIDTNTAAAGDLVHAKVQKPVRDPRSKAVIVPAGAVVQGRIIQMQHWVSRPRHFTIAIQMEKLETGGESWPLYAKVIASPSKGIFLSPLGRSPLVAAFPFVTEKSRFRVPAGYESKWVTVERPREEQD